MSAAKKIDPKFNPQNIFEYQDMDLQQKTYELFAKKMYDIAGVDLPFSPKNHALLRNRLIKILRRRSLTSYEQYWDLVQTGTDEVMNEFVSALTTNMTSFFRESAHFDFLGKILPEQFGKVPELRIWCCAASTGQEPYTIAMTVRDSLPESQVARTKILATDIDNQVLKKASIGKYDEKDMQGLDSARRLKYFSKVKSTDKKTGEDLFQAGDDIHKLIRFANFNLMNETYVFQNKFHIVFCRNVLIYFDEATTKKVISNLANVVAPGGYLILGHSESGNVKHANLKPLSRAIYQKL
ncbi:CheR family methyltransferase [Bdellovibrio sp. HCB337]|uniref:CheR family methyltransferase n=1 Tax=Bdellovibrio sp. HCB337 TaxID=3394358 RepID=UPI0039A6C112